MESNVKIICAFPSLGKTFSSEAISAIDLDVGEFYRHFLKEQDETERNEKVFRLGVNACVRAAETLMETNRIILINCSPRYLRDLSENVVVIVPSYGPTEFHRRIVKRDPMFKENDISRSLYRNFYNYVKQWKMEAQSIRVRCLEAYYLTDVLPNLLSIEADNKRRSK